MRNYSCRSPGRAGELRFRRPHPRRRSAKSAGPSESTVQAASHGYTRMFPARTRIRQNSYRSLAPVSLSSLVDTNNVVTVDYPFQGSFITLEILQTKNGR